MIENLIFIYEGVNTSQGILYADGQSHNIQNISSIEPVRIKQKHGLSRIFIFSGLAMVLSGGLIATLGLYSILAGIGFWGFSKSFYILYWTAHNGKKSAFICSSLSEIDKVDRALHMTYAWQQSNN